MEDEFKISTEYDGRKRKLFNCKCVGCEVDIWKPKHQITEENFCTKDCYQSYRQKVGKRIEFNCTQCNKVFKRFKHHAAQVTSGRLFCSRDCQHLGSIKDKGNCVLCQTKLVDRQTLYCSIDCQNDFQYKNKIDNWKNGSIEGINNCEAIKSWLRRYMLKKFENKCSLCNWCEINPTTGKVPVQIDHVDGNYKNNEESNLRLLCPNCHSLTSTYGALNIGRGREKRRLKLQGIKKE